MTLELPERDDYPERLLVAELLRDPSTLVGVPLDLDPSDFSNGSIGQVYEAIRLVDGGGEVANLTRVAALLRRRGVPMSVVAETLAGRVEKDGVHGQTRFNGLEILKQSRRHRLARACMEAVEMLVNDATAEDARNFLEAKLQQATGSALVGKTAFDVGVALVQSLREAAPPPSIWTGLSSLDDDFGGWAGGELVTGGAGPGGGKSAFALQVATHNATKGRAVAFFTCEMRDRELIQRHLCGEASVDSRRLRAGYRDAAEIDRMAEAAESLRGKPLVILEASGRKVEEIYAAAKYEAAKRGGLGLVVVDYAQILMPTNPRDDKRLQVAHITATLKRLAQSLNCSVLLLSQLNREGADGAAKLSSFAESAYIERVSDICFIIEPTESKTTRRFKYVKFRAGECGETELGWDGPATRFHDLVDARRFSGFDDYAERLAHDDA